MLYFKIGFENGDSFETGFNGTLDEARRYYLGRVFNLGTVDDDMQRCNSVEQLPTLEMALAAWIASAGLVVLTDGTVSRRVSSVLVDDADLRLAETKTLWTGFRPAVYLCCDYVHDWKNGGRSRCNSYCASSPLWAVFNLYEKDLHLWLIPVDEQRKV